MHLNLDLQFFAGEKTEKATPKKRQDERKKGKVAKSQDINSSILLIFCFLGLLLFSGFMKEEFLSLYTNAFTNYIHWDLTENTTHKLFVTMSLIAVKIVAPIMVIAMIAGVAANLLQIGFIFTTEPLKFDLKKIDPISGAKRIFSIRALVELLKSFMKIAVIGSVTFGILWMNRADMMMQAFKTTESALQFFGQIALTMGFAATISLLILAVFDYTYQRFDFEKNMRMSKQDIKDEYKSIEGNPLIKSKLREKQREMASRRMMSDIPDADVIITNPTHYAIAVKYEDEEGQAPIVVAKGIDQIAQKIKEIAKAHHIVSVENRPLARSLYADVELGQAIPEEFYQAIAEILAYVYRLDKEIPR